MEIPLKVVLAYLLGSIVGSLVVGQLWGGVDIRQLGSGNAGSTNALRTQGPAFAIWVIVIDVAKGWIAAGLLPALALPGVSAAAPAQAEWLPAAWSATHMDDRMAATGSSDGNSTASRASNSPLSHRRTRSSSAHGWRIAT